MTAKFLGIFAQAGTLAKTNAETGAAKSARVAGLVQDGYRLWFDGVTASVSDAGRLAAGLGKVRSPADFAALHRAWLSTTQARVTEGVQGFLDVSAKIAAEVSVVPLPLKVPAAAPVAAAPVAPKAEAPAVVPAPVPEATPVPVAAPVAEVAPVVEAAPVVEPAPEPVVEAVAPEAPVVVAEPIPAAEPAPVAVAASEEPTPAPLPAVKPSVKAGLRRNAKTPTTKTAAKAASTVE